MHKPPQEREVRPELAGGGVGVPEHRERSGQQRFEELERPVPYELPLVPGVLLLDPLAGLQQLFGHLLLPVPLPRPFALPLLPFAVHLALAVVPLRVQLPLARRG